ncbi:MAG TPA: ketoacyl-ACP synthase III [Spirochaeta sp.]|nr:ketoacyl-ACP synthase III [Spirochaeta sp.]
MKIIGTGLYAPGIPLEHEEIMELTGVSFDGEKISQKIGIERRHIAHLRNIDETTADFVEKAGRNALADACIKAEQIDLFIVATDTPEFISPPTATLLQGRLQGGETVSGSFDINGACSGFVSAFQTAARLADGAGKPFRIMIVGVYNMPAYFRPDDSFGYSIFADGAGAFIIEGGTDEGKDNYKGGVFRSDGTQWNYVGVYTGGTRNPMTHERLDKGEYGLQLIQNLPGGRNVELWPKVLEDIMRETGGEYDDVDHFLFTQINKSVIHKVMDVIEQPAEKAPCYMKNYGYTGSACLPIAFHEAVKAGQIKRGDDIVLVASGAGLVVSAARFRY